MKISFVLFVIIFTSLNISKQEKYFGTGLYLVIDSDSCIGKNENNSLEYLSEKLCLGQNPVISIADFDSIIVAKAELNEENIFSLNIKLSESATKKFEEITSNNIGEKLALVINNEIIIAPIVRAKINSGLISIEDDEFIIKELEKELNKEKKKL